MQLEDHQIIHLAEVIVNAFKESELERVLMKGDKLGQRIINEMSGDKYYDKALNLITWLNRQGLIDKFLSAAIAENEGNFSLKVFHDTYQNYIKYNVLFLEKNILHTIQFEVLEKVFISFREKLPKLTEVTEPKKVNDIIKVVTQDHPTINDNVPSILHFAHLIAQFLENNSSSIKKEIYHQLKQWIQQNEEQHQISLTHHSKKNYDNFQAYLLITAIPKATARTKNTVFTMACQLLITNNEEYQLQQIELKKNDNGSTAENGYIECNLKEIYDIINKFVKQAEDYFKNQNVAYPLTIELFLPIKYLAEDFDIKLITVSEQKEPIGHLYRFIVRSYDRINTPVYWNAFLEKWKELSEIRKNDREKLKDKFKYLEQTEDYDWDTLNIDLGEKLGFIFCGLPNAVTKKQKLFSTILKQGIPFCLWTRCHKKNIKNYQDLDVFLEWQSFEELYKKVLDIRKKVPYSKVKAKEYLGYHLGFFCDNPERKPKITQLKLSK